MTRPGTDRKRIFDGAPERLLANGRVLRALVEPLPPEQARWKPSEAEDFRRRLELTLERPDEPWPPIDPEGWVTERGYAARDPESSLARFLEERKRSVEWLRGLESPEWDRTHDHPRMGPLRAGDLLASWLAHDLIHVRQITRLRFRWMEREVRPYGTGYAGTF